jgi:predicted membrane-bound spermidine synthase
MPYALSFFLGIFSMGFQLLGSRLLSPWFGSSIIVWAFLISAFLVAFSLGSICGGWLARFPDGPRRRGVIGVGVVAVTGFAVNALSASAFLEWLDERSAPLTVALSLACGLLFLPPVAALAAFTPVLVQAAHDRGHAAGFASGLIYCVSTLGNIAGIMLTAFVLVPNLPVSALLWIWTAAVAASSVWVMRCVR